jgi:hypothetical protein
VVIFAFEIGLVFLAIALVLAVAGTGAALRRGESRERTAATLAVAGIFALIGGYYLWAELAAQRKTAQSVRCRENLKALSLGLLMYASDWDDRLPPADRWADVIDGAKYLPDRDTAQRATLFHCPAATGTPYGYALNRSVAGGSLADIDVIRTALLFETDAAERNAHGSRRDLARTRHFNLNAAFCDGRVVWLNDYQKGRMVWSVPAPSPPGP